MAARREPHDESTVQYVVAGQRPKYRVDGEPLGPCTYADYAQTPKGERHQLIQGFLVREPAPFYGHQVLSVELTALARNWKVRYGGVTVFAAPLDVFLDKFNVLQPDLLVLKREKNKHLSRRGLEAAPNLAIEILSPSSRQRDTHVKRHLYSQFGVDEYWIVDPKERDIRRYVRDAEDNELNLEGEYRNGELRSAAFPTFAISVNNLFAVLDEFD